MLGKFVDYDLGWDLCKKWLPGDAPGVECVVGVGSEDFVFVSDDADLDVFEVVGFFADVGEGVRGDRAAMEESARCWSAACAVWGEALCFGVDAVSAEGVGVGEDADS
jgi:hypothetical protein